MSYYISPRFLDAIAVHITKNYLNLPQIRVPLILGIHGRKGEGKTFQCEQVFEKLGIEPVVISGGELESPDAGDPARLLRLRYREAAEQVRVQGKMCAIFINDLDAGAGRFDAGTQYTVNTQLVNATLMNIADNPTNVQLPGSYDSTPLQRIPLIVTGNDFSTLYAPLIRDGRMVKFYWEPTLEERIGVAGGIFETDGLSGTEITKLVQEFSQQAIDFFSALRSRIYDEQIRQFIHQIGLDQVSRRLVNSAETPPNFQKPNFSLAHLIEIGHEMLAEQQRIQELRLVEEYNQFRTFGQKSLGQNLDSPGQNLATPDVNFAGNFTNSTPDPQAPITHLPYNPVMPPHPFDSQATAVIQGDERGSTFIAGGQAVSTRLSLAVVEQIEQILENGYQIGLEYADPRRFKTGSWKSYALPQGNQPTAMIQAIAACLESHPRDYVRLLGIDPQAKRRIVETIIQRPG
ncbi:MAG: AAA family ATPase [Oscillatoriales cyanobacterium RM2_1_1]|nr:AAA family ATPase [Oscillatoriales cyanobacterium SM2_3_0]NJO46298.1 AAA family ATPase [Oscillatoriales cyanobacterium RM2_1_1]